jgi:uroporphyrinogen decarboxylase
MPFPPLENDTFLRACLRQATPYTPLWLMRQAGRYLPEYKATRARAGSFMGLATNVDYATEVTLQPLERFPLDAAILFSDILTVPDAMGLGLSFVEGEGPKLARPLRDEASVAALRVPDLAQLRYVFDAVTSIRRALNGRVPLIGFAGSPWTLACYMVEGSGSSDDWRRVKSMLYSRPDLMHRILAVNAKAVAGYLNAQIDAGAQAVMVFDSWGGALADGAFQQFSLDYTKQVLARLKRGADGATVPRIVFTKGGGLWLEQMEQLDCDVLGTRLACRTAAPAPVPPTSSTWATASASTRRPKAWPPWPRRCIRIPPPCARFQRSREKSSSGSSLADADTANGTPPLDLCTKPVLRRNVRANGLAPVLQK